jgi:hypothetical protein
VEVFLDAWRMLRDEADGMERRAVHIQPRLGSRKRGIAVLRDMMAEDNENPTKWDGSVLYQAKAGNIVSRAWTPGFARIRWRR